MDSKNKKKDIIQILQSANEEQLIPEMYESSHTNEAIENVSKSLPDELQTKITRTFPKAS